MALSPLCVPLMRSSARRTSSRPCNGGPSGRTKPGLKPSLPMACEKGLDIRSAMCYAGLENVFGIVGRAIGWPYRAPRCVLAGTRRAVSQADIGAHAHAESDTVRLPMCRRLLALGFADRQVAARSGRRVARRTGRPVCPFARNPLGRPRGRRWRPASRAKRGTQRTWRREIHDPRSLAFRRFLGRLHDIVSISAASAPQEGRHWCGCEFESSVCSL